MNYKIYQININEDSIKNDDKLVRRLFSFLGDDINEISLDKYGYTEVYNSTINDCDNALSEIFEIFNINHPSDFRGRSLSVSDIVYLEGKGYYYCQPIGWKKINIIM